MNNNNSNSISFCSIFINLIAIVMSILHNELQVSTSNVFMLINIDYHLSAHIILVES